MINVITVDITIVTSTAFTWEKNSDDSNVSFKFALTSFVARIPVISAPNVPPAACTPKVSSASS